MSTGIDKALVASESDYVRRFSMYLRGKSGGSETRPAPCREGMRKEIQPLYAAIAAAHRCPAVS